MTEDIDPFQAEMPPDILAILGGADAPYSDPAPTEAALQAALHLAPDNLALRIASYTFYFYAGRLAEALPHAEACLAIATDALGIAGDWRRVGPESADFRVPARPQRLYLKSLFALGFCYARLGDMAAAKPLLAKVVGLAPQDEFGAATLLGLIERGGAAGDDEED